jgi:hypothetical protein
MLLAFTTSEKFELGVAIATGAAAIATALTMED